MNQPTHRRSRRRRKSPTLPELEQAKAGVLNSLGSLQSRRSYGRAIEEFIGWYCSEPRLALNRAVVLRFRLRLEGMRLAAVRRLATEAADSGLLSPDLIAGIRRVRGVKQLGRRMGNWLTPDEGQRLLSAVSTDTLRGKRDAAMLGLLLVCGLRRSELVELDVDQLQQREQHWVILDLIGKGGRVRTVPIKVSLRRCAPLTEPAQPPNPPNTRAMDGARHRDACGAWTEQPRPDSSSCRRADELPSPNHGSFDHRPSRARPDIHEPPRARLGAPCGRFSSGPSNRGR